MSDGSHRRAADRRQGLYPQPSSEVSIPPPITSNRWMDPLLLLQHLSFFLASCMNTTPQHKCANLRDVTGQSTKKKRTVLEIEKNVPVRPSQHPPAAASHFALLSVIKKIMRQGVYPFAANHNPDNLNMFWDEKGRGWHCAGRGEGVVISDVLALHPSLSYHTYTPIHRQ
ncbi:hypothetical protein BC939DRAFT_44295 [Gamsiella multidivaricata]|uniref:uncharacterized protein n=1 Tax=Gamsiella multidivaricata TaxID=101098 RepID=UPI0022202C89|nr:uncharacterized protein BC939DRAFT_44295 [Gamsiella multidivaricata]KAI7816416.1 hypothetical protein BC939DRAFT_44295 [Gamsiella multidivaricata]